MAEKSPVFEKIYKDYLDQVSRIDYKSKAEKLGGRIDGDDVIIPFFGRPYRLSEEGIVDPSGKQPIHSVSVVLCKYLLLCPDRYPDGDDWVSYKDFKDAAPFVGGFVNNTEKTIARNFSGKLDELTKACQKLAGRLPDVDLSYSLSMIFDPLPRIPILLLFNDEDSEFPAQCSVLYERRAENYLDMECLAILGWLLSDYLSRAMGDFKDTVM